MIIANLIIGAFLILMGFVVKAFPDAIAGYNTMSAEKKKNVDVEGLSSMMRNCLIVKGSLVIVCVPFFRLVHWNINPIFFTMIVILSSVMGMMILSQKYDHNKKSLIEKLVPIIFIIGLSVFIGFHMLKTREPFEVSITDNQMTISGSYGLSTSFDKIEVVDIIPKIKLKTGGYSDGVVRKGNFLLEEWGTCILFLQSRGGPYIKVSTSDKPIIINDKSADDTRKLFDKLRMETK